MSSTRRSKRVHWEVMSQLEEAGEEDLCSLLNEVMGAQSYYGSGADLGEYLEALAALEQLQQLRFREYRIEDGRTNYGDVIAFDVVKGWGTCFSFDSSEEIWTWGAESRVVVEVPDERD